MLAGASGAAGSATWIPTDDGPLYGTLHLGGVDPRPTAVLMIGPFGLEEVISHQARRQWAIQLASTGFATLRIDLPATGDSAGEPVDGDLFGRWARAVNTAGRWLAQNTGAARLAVIGVGVGGTVVCAALGLAPVFDDLVLWGVSATGAAPVRELRAYARLIASEHPENAAGPEPTGGRDVAGYFLSAETEASLRELNIAELGIAARPGTRALLLGRDSRGVDDDLVAALESGGIAVETSPLRGYTELLTFPELAAARLPRAAFTGVGVWLAAGAIGSQASVFTGSPELTASVEIDVGGRAIRETILVLDTGTGEDPRAQAVLSAPVAGGSLGVTAVLLNSGANRKIGPNRMFVDLARRWAARGVPTVRADFGGVGDAAGELDVTAETGHAVGVHAMYSEQMIEGAVGLVDALRAQGLGERFLLVGHCSGAFVAMHAAVRTRGVVGVVSLQQHVFSWSPQFLRAQLRERIRVVASGGLLRRLRQEGLTRHEVRQVVTALGPRRERLSPAAPSANSGEAMLDRLEARSVRVTLLLAEEGHVYDFVRDLEPREMASRWPGLRVAMLPTRDHLARAGWLQSMVHERLDEALEQTLAGLGPAN